MIHSIKGTKEATLEHQLRAFFNANPDEELTAKDISVKFNKSSVTVSRLLHLLIDSGYLVKTRRGLINQKIGYYHRPRIG